MTPMTVRRRRTEGSVTVYVTGEIDLAGHALLRQTINEAVGDGAPRVVVDLSDVTFLDSGAIGALIGGRNAARAAGVDYRICGIGAFARRIFDVAGVTEALTGPPTPAT